MELGVDDDDDDDGCIDDTSVDVYNDWNDDLTAAT